MGVYGLLSLRIPIFSPYKYHGRYTYVRGTPVLVPWSTREASPPTRKAPSLDPSISRTQNPGGSPGDNRHSSPRPKFLTKKRRRSFKKNYGSILGVRWILWPIFGCWTKNNGKTHKSHHFNRVFHYFHHPFWGTHIFGNIHLATWMVDFLREM